MKTISLLEFRKNARTIIRWAQQGRRMVMTYRGRPVMRIEPITKKCPVGEDDPFLLLDGIIAGDKESMSNEKMDSIIYEK